MKPKEKQYKRINNFMLRNSTSRLRLRSQRVFYFTVTCTIILFLIFGFIVFSIGVYSALPVEVKNKMITIVVEHKVTPETLDLIGNYIDDYLKRGQNETKKRE